MQKTLLILLAGTALFLSISSPSVAQEAAKTPEKPAVTAPASAPAPTVAETPEPVEPEKPKDVKAAIVGSANLAAEDENTFTMKLTDDAGKPITDDDLKVVHTQKIHLLINDQTLTDYYHIHPTPTGDPGTWKFIFSPCKPTSYKGWADITTNDEQHRYVQVDFKGSEPCTTDCVKRDLTMEGFGEGIRANLTFNQPLKHGEAALGAIHLVDQMTGKPVTDLEPLMGAFAHIVGFYDDFNTIAHVHPMGEEPKDDKQRGGPDLSFHFEPEKAGYVELYLQMHRGGKDVYIPFGVTVE